MKLECPVVRDLYTLYRENEISKEVREAVDSHLKDCKDCSHIYESESNFNDILKKDTEEQPSKKLDEKMMLKLKVSRLRTAVIVITVIFIITIYVNYSKSRQNLLNDVSQAERTLYKIYFNLDDIRNDTASVTSFSQDISSLDELQNNAIIRELNLIEKSQLKKVPNGLYMNFQVDNFYNMLKTRHMKGTFNNNDEKAASLFKKYMVDITQSISDETNELSRGGKLQTLIRPIDIKSIAEDYSKLNQLAVVYTQYGQFPEELYPMSEADIKVRLKSIFNLNNPSIRIYPNMKASIAINGTCAFDIKQDSLNYHGEINAYTGEIHTLMSNAPYKDGELLPLDGIKANLMKFLGRIYGKEQNFDVQYLGINYHFSSNVDIKLYSFKVYPQINGLRVDYELNLYYDARTGEVFSMNSGNGFVPAEYTVDTTIKISPEDALKNLDISDKGKYSYSETLLIKSLLTGKYVPVHVYKNDARSIYVNTITGKQEFTNYQLI